MAMAGSRFPKRLGRGLATNARRSLTRCSGPSLLLEPEAVFDEEADGFGARCEAVLPAIFVDLPEEGLGDWDDDAGVGLLRFGRHGHPVKNGDGSRTVASGPTMVNMPAS